MNPIEISDDQFQLEKLKSRFLSKVSKINNCWEWKSSKISDGYGRFWLNGKPLLAHRISYQLFVGAIPKGLTLDHLCKNKSCVNPNHLEPVSNRENTLRGGNMASINIKKTHCKNGHEFTPENTYKRKKTNRGCKQCKKISNTRYLLKKPRIGYS